MLKERKIFNLVIKKKHNEFFMTNKDDEDFENSTKFCFCFCFFLLTMLIVMLECGIIFMLLENVETLLIEIVILSSNEITTFQSCCTI